MENLSERYSRGCGALQIPQKPIAKIVDPAVNRNRLLPSPCVLHDSRLAYVIRLFDHIELA
jgi:hypothetical protein